MNHILDPIGISLPLLFNGLAIKEGDKFRRKKDGKIVIVVWNEKPLAFQLMTKEKGEYDEEKTLKYCGSPHILSSQEKFWERIGNAHDRRLE